MECSSNLGHLRYPDAQPPIPHLQVKPSPATSPLNPSFHSENSSPRFAAYYASTAQTRSVLQSPSQLLSANSVGQAKHLTPTRQLAMARRGPHGSVFDPWGEEAPPTRQKTHTPDSAHCPPPTAHRPLSTVHCSLISKPATIAGAACSLVPSVPRSRSHL